MQKHVAVYVRVSKSSQDTRSQLPDLKRWAAGQDLPVVVYQDKYTGRTMDRPGWQKLQAALDSGAVASITVWRLDRLGRTAKGLTALFDDLVSDGVGLVSLKDGLDLSTPAGRLMANVLASVAQFETELRSERIRAGIDAVKADPALRATKYKGRQPGTTAADPERAKQLRAKGLTQREVAAALNVSLRTAARYLAE